MRLRLFLTATCLLTALLPVSLVHARDAGPVTIGAVDCEAGGIPVELRSPSAAPTQFVLLRNDVEVARVTVRSGTPARQLIPVAEGSTARITVRFGASYSSALLERRCDRPGASSGRAGARVSTATRRAGERNALQTSVDAPADVTIEDPAPRWPITALTLTGLISISSVGLVLVRGRRRAANDRAAADVS